MNGNIILVVGGESFHVEKEKLRESSDYFRAMFSSQFQEEQSERIELKSVELEPFRTLLQWVQSDLSQAHMETISTVELMDILETSNKINAGDGDSGDGGDDGEFWWVCQKQICDVAPSIGLLEEVYQRHKR